MTNINGSKSILVVDDSPVTRMLMRKLLEKEEFIVAEADNGGSAVSHLESNPVSLIFMDIEMPGKNGYETTRVIRDKSLTKAPIIALTSHADEESRTQSKLSGMTGSTTKPIQSDKILKILRRHLS